MRLPIEPATSLVQRRVIINSYSFTLLVAPRDVLLPDPKFDELICAFQSMTLGAVPILPGQQRITAEATSDHAAASLLPHYAQYPGRYASNPHPIMASPGQSEVSAVVLVVDREMVTRKDLCPVVDAMESMVVVREAATLYRQRVGLVVRGYDEDPRALWQIPETRHYFRKLFEACPFVMLLAHPDSGFLRILVSCWVYEDEPSDDDAHNRRAEDFLNRAFAGLNELAYRLCLSEEVNREISAAALRCLGLEGD